MKSEKTLSLRPMHKKHVLAPTDMRMNSHPQNTMNSHYNNLFGKRHGTAGLWALFLVVCTLGFAVSARAATFRAVSKSLDSAQESCLPANGAIDPGETNTVTFTFKNTTGANVKAVKVALKSEVNNVGFAVDGKKTVGDVAKDATFTVSFRFRADGPCGGTLAPRFLFEGKESNDAAFSGVDIDSTDNSKFDFQLGPTVNTTYTFSNTAAITINDFKSNSDLAKDNGRSTPYPSTINASGIPKQTGRTGERISKITVTLNNLSHEWSPDLNVVLVGPKASTLGAIPLMRNTGGATTATAPVSGLTLTFDASVSASLPDNATITAGTYKPTDLSGGGDLISGKDPLAPYSGTLTGHIGQGPGGTPSTDEVNAKDPNGDWKLYVVDSAGGGSGSIAGGWTLTITTAKVVCCGAGSTFPTISQSGNPAIGDKTIDEDNVFQGDDIGTGQTKTGSIPSFRVADLETAGGSLSVTATSGNQSLIKSSNLKLTRTTAADAADGTDSARKLADYTIDFKPEANANGTTQITVTVTDGSNLSSSAIFNLKVNSVNDSPTFPIFMRNQAVNRGTTTPALSFTVGDVETASGSLIVTGSSSDQNVVPDANIIFAAVTGDGTQRSVTIVPKDSGSSGTSGNAVITLIVKDGDSATTPKTFTVDFSTAPGNPTIEPITGFSIEEDKSKTVTFTVRPDGSSSTPAGNLVLTASSGNTALLPNSNITFGGSGSERTVTFTPAANQFGTSSVTLTVADGAKTSTTPAFTVTVTSVNDKPTISALSPQTIEEDNASSDIAFTVGDTESAVASLTMSASSSNADLIPVSGVAFATDSSNAANRTVKFTPAANKYGKATITLKVTDTDGGETTTDVVVTINAGNDAPTIALVEAGNNTAADGTQSTLTTALAANADDVVLAVTINEDAGNSANPNGNFVDGDVAKGVQPQVLTLSGITAGVGDESEQTVTFSATTDRPDLIKDLRFTNVNNGDTSNTGKGTTITKWFRYTPQRNAYGDAIVTLTLTDNGVGGTGSGTLSTVRKFKISIRAINDAPTMDNISGPSGTVSNKQGVSVSINPNDTETSRVNLSLSATSSNQAIAKDSNITFDASKTRVALVPEANATGSATISVTATDRGEKDDGAGTTLSVVKTFVVTFGTVVVNNQPTITVSPTSAIIIDEDGVATATINVAQTKSDNSAADLTLITMTGVSDSQTIVPNANILFGGNGGSRTVAIVPAKDAFGVVKVTISARDSTGLTSDPVVVNVTIRSFEDQPTISLKKSSADGTKWSVVSGVDTFTTNEDVNPVADSKTTSGLIEVDVSDALFETPADQLVVTATSKDASNLANDSAVVPPANITISSTGSTRTLTIRPVANKSGTARITLTVKDNTNTAGTPAVFDLVVSEINDEPIINAVSNLTIDEDAATQTIALSGISAGAEEGSQTISITVTAKDKGSDPAVNNLVSSPTVSYSSPATTGSVSFTPVGNKFGTSTVSITVGDSGGTSNGGDNSKTISFDVTIREINDIPTISAISDQSANQDATIGPIAITVSDVETPTEVLNLTFTSDNTAVVPNSPDNLQGTGSGPNRGLIIKPVKGVFGSANITATVSDKGKVDGTDIKSASRTFKVTISPSDKPVISSIPAQTTKKNQDSDIISFTVFDAQTPVEQLVVTASADNPTLVPTANVQFAPITGGTRQLIIRPAQNQSGSANITLTVKDSDNNTATTSFKLTVLGESPTISVITTPQEVQKGGTIGPIAFTVGDAETFPGFLSVNKKSSNTAFVPESIIVIGGSGANRTVTVGPIGNAEGQSTVTLTVQDAEGLTNAVSFLVTTPVTPNDAPTISTIANQTTDINKPTSIISFTVGDKETTLDALTVTASSSNTTLVPNANIFLGGSGANRTVFINPAIDQEGAATITIMVADAGTQGSVAKSAKVDFTLTVQANQAPTITAIVGQTVEKNRATGALAFTVGDKETAATSLTVTASSGNTTLVPNANIVIGGSGANRTVTVSPAANQVGTATITVTVTDAGNKSANVNFVLTVKQAAGVKGDFNGDGKPDLIFQDNDAFLATWLMNGITLDQAGFLVPSNIGDTAWRIAASADLNGDGQEDLIFQHTDGTLAVWYMSGTSQLAVDLINPSNPGDSKWRVVATGDLNKDGKYDLVFQHADGTIAVWYMNGINLSSASLFDPANPGDKNWKVVGTGDVNGDGKADLLFQHTDGTLATWYLDGVKLTQAALLSPANPGDVNWRVVATAQLAVPLTATLTGLAERPNPVNTSATGSAKLSLVGTKLTYNISFSGLSGSAVSGHIHGPATSEQAASVIIPFSNVTGTSGTLSGTIDITADQAAMIRDGLTYANIHTAANPGGEIRGQITKDASLAGKVDLIFQHTDGTLAVWVLDGVKLNSASVLSPSNSGGTWRVVAPK